MIVFDLRCTHDHVFEIWFRSTQDYENQREQQLVACPICGSTCVEKAVMAPNVGAKGNQVALTQRPIDPINAPVSAELVKQVIAQVAEIQASMLAKSTWVGTAFADRARAMHVGEETPLPIHGQASVDDARALVEEGVPIAPLLVPVIPPDLCN